MEDVARGQYRTVGRVSAYPACFESNKNIIRHYMTPVF